jgi:hypothetical protein
MGEENKIRDAVDAATGLVKAVPVYEDLVQPAAKEIGTGLQTVAKTVHIALAPISALVWGYDKIEAFVKTSVAKRLEKIPPEQIQTPLPQIAGPALEALKYTGHDESLREMFAKLLATAMDKKTATIAHPSFVEIIRQLNSDEAKICRLLKKDNSFPVINLNEEREGGYYDFVRNFSTLGYEVSCQLPNMIQSYLDNLNRLGIIEIHFDKSFVDEALYQALETHTEIQKLFDELKAKNRKTNFERGIIERTTFGQQFVNACVD